MSGIDIYDSEYKETKGKIVDAVAPIDSNKIKELANKIWFLWKWRINIMGMLEIFKGTLQDGMEIIKEKELVNGFKVTLSYNGMTADTNIPKAVVSGREKDVCKSSINNAMSTMYINAGNIEEAKAWLDGEKWIESNNERTDKQKLLDVIISDIDNKKAEMKDDPKVYIGLDMAREIVWSYYHGDFMNGDD